MDSASKWQTPLLCAVVLGIVGIIYLPAWRGKMLWDDGGHVTRPDLRSLAGLGRIWTEIGATQQYYPVLHSAFWFEHRVWGDSVLGYHLLNVVLHAAAACLFALLLQRISVLARASDSASPQTDRAPGYARDRFVAWFAALLFAVHPVCVESVAWISEQKNTLSTVLYLAAALAYLRFDMARRFRPSRQGFDVRLYIVSTIIFILAVLTKTVTATLPAALLVAFWWRRGRIAWRSDVVPLLPWFAIGAACGLFTAHFERELIGAQGADFALGAVQRALLAGQVFWFYLGKLFWPVNLIFIYPRWTIDASQPSQWLYSLAAVGASSVLVVITARDRAPTRGRARATLAALLLFGGALFPVLGFFNVFPFLYSYVADHFQYLATLPVFALAAAALFGGRGGSPSHPEFVGLSDAKPANRPTTQGRSETVPYPSAWRFALAALIVLTLAALSWSQVEMYRDPVTLYNTTLARNPSCWMAHNNLAIEYANDGRVADAIPHLERAIQLKPDFAPAENNLGDDLVRLGRVPEAIPHFERALQLQQNYAVAHRNLGMALAMTNRTEEAVAHFARAAQIDPTYADAELDWAVALDQTGQFSAAIPHFDRAIALAPTSVDAQLAYADALARHREFDQSILHYRAALELAPDSADAHRGYAVALRKVGRNDEANQQELAAERLGATGR